MDRNIKKKPESPTSPSLQSLSPERPDLSSGNKDGKVGSEVGKRLVSPTAPSLRSLSRGIPDLSSGNDNKRERTCAERPESRTSPTSLKSLSPERPDLSSGNRKHRNVSETLTKKRELEETTLPPDMIDWTKEHVKNWLITSLRIPPQIAQNLYEQETSGACLVSFEKPDLIELGVPRAPALQILRQVERFNRRAEPRASHWEPEELGQRDIGESSAFSVEECLETETVSTDSGIYSQSASVLMLKEARYKIKCLLEEKTTDDQQFYEEQTQMTTFSQMSKPVCQMRPFDKSNASVFYTENHFLPAVGGPSNLLEPVHEYQLLPSSEEVSEREVLYEFANEVFCFAASCINSRTNGTIHFGVNNEPDQCQIIGHKITSISKYNDAFERNLSEYFEQQHRNAARMCIRPPVFIQVQCQDGTASDKWVIEVDVVPSYSETQESLFYTLLNIVSTGKEKQQCKTECLFVRDGSRKVNILSDSNPRIIQDQIKDITEKVKHWASARKSAEERYDPPPSCEQQGQRLRQLIARGQDSFLNSIQVIVVTDKCHPGHLEHLDFLKEMHLFAVLDFDPESDKNGTCQFYRKDCAANLHFPHMFTMQDSASVIPKLNLFKQTSWVFCNGHANEVSDLERPLTPSEWLKKRSGDINSMVSFLCNPNLISKHGLLVLFILHSAVTDISSPILETFCAMYRSLEGIDNMVCLCKDATVFSHWKNLVEVRCKEDINSKCIYNLSFIEISSTIKKLKEPQTRASSRFLPSTGSSSVILERKDEEMMTDLEVLCENECENTEIETNNSFEEFKKKTEEVFYRGGQVSWWNFYLSEQPKSLPFIKRDKYDELHKLITPVQGYTSPCVIVSLFHHPGCGGTTLAMHVLWHLRSRFRCAVVKNQMATNKDIALQVRKLLTYGRQEQSGYTPILLLLDNWDDVNDLKQCIINAGTDRLPNNLMVLILNCERTPFPEEASVNSYNPNVFISTKLSSKEKDLFFEKYEELKDNHDKPETFYAFMIMKNDFSKDYITDIVSNILKDLDVGTPQGMLLSFLALLNTYVNGSYMSLSLCEELMEIRNLLWIQKTLDDKMNPYSTLLITFCVEEHGTYQAVRLLHQMIAENCLKVFKDYKLTLADITINLLHCDKLFKTCMGKDFLTHFIQSMLVTRQKREQGDDKNTLFSPLIEDIKAEEGIDKVKEVLERAIDRFDRSATLPQALARHMCLNEKDFDSALKWALDAQSKKSNSYIADTVGQVYKSHLKKVIEDSKDQSPESLDKCLQLASKAASAFRDSQELAKKDEQSDPFDRHFKKGHKSYNTSGYVGETEVIMTVLDVITDLPIVPAGDRYKTNKMLQFLRGQHPVSSLYDHTDPRMNEIVNVLKDHGRFLGSLKPRLKEIFTFFENYFTYLRPRHVLNKETVDDRNKRKVSELFKKYVNIFSSSKEEKLSEKACNPNLSLQQVIEDHRQDLEMIQADSFAGLLLSLSHKSGNEIENVLEKWKFIFENSGSRYPPISDTVNFIMANIVLHTVRPKSSLLKKYEELLNLLNEALQREGTRSNLPELYFLSMLLMWPSNDKTLKDFTEYSNISTYIASAKKSFHQRFGFMFPSRSAIAYFFLGKSSGLKRIVSKAKLDQILQESASSDQSKNLHQLWHTGSAWKNPDIQKKLLRIKGRSENGDIYVSYGGNNKILVRPAYLGDIRSGCSREEVYFYIGFTMEGPVAYDVKYEK